MSDVKMARTIQNNLLPDVETRVRVLEQLAFIADFRGSYSGAMRTIVSCTFATISGQVSPPKGTRRQLAAAILFAVVLAVFPFGSVSADSSSQIAYKQSWHKGGGGESATAIAEGLTTPGDTLVVRVATNPIYGGSTSVPTDSEGNLFVFDGSISNYPGDGAHAAAQWIYHASNIVGGTLDAVTCHTLGNIGTDTCDVVEVSGVDTLDVQAQASGYSTAGNSGPITTTHANEFLLGWGASDPGGPYAWDPFGSGWTGIVQGNVQVEYQIASSAGTYTATGTDNRAAWWVYGVFAYYHAPTISLSPQTVASGYTSAGTVGLAAPAPSGGATVMLSSSDPAVATVPASVLVPAGSASATFTVNTSSVNSSTLVDISATYNSATSVATLAVVPVNASPQYSIWSSSTAPTVSDDGGTSPVEVGVKFTADTSGFISGIRFYKSAANTGTHVGNLWSSTGQLLATATFTGETPSGWQQVNFSSPILVTANTIYVASYHTNAGHTSDDAAYFTNIGVDNSPLHAPSSGVSGGNGVLKLSATSVFPNTTNLDSNYWVDLVFISSSSASLTPCTVDADSHEDDDTDQRNRRREGDDTDRRNRRHEGDDADQRNRRHEDDNTDQRNRRQLDRAFRRQ